MASWLLCSPSDRAVQVQALARDIVLCSWARHVTIAVTLSIQAYAVGKMDNAIYLINQNHYPMDSSVCFVNTYLLDSD